MICMRRLILLLGLSLTPLISSAQNNLLEFSRIVEKMASNEDAVISKAPTDVEIEIWRQEAKEIDPVTSLPALIKLWIIGEQHYFLQLEWWRKRDNAKPGRMLIVALYECAIAEPVTSKPNFNAFADRFSDVEKQARIDEIAKVVAERTALAKLLASIIRRTDTKFRSKTVNEMLDLYDKTASAP